MPPLLPLLSALLAGALTLGWLLPAPMLNRRRAAAVASVTGLVASLFIAAAGALALYSSGFYALRTDRLAGLVYYDGVSAIALTLVSFIGLVVCRYSLRYMAGDPCQGDYFRWTGATIGAVSLAVLTGNLLVLVAALIATSLSLHRLLLHYPDRAGARRAAWSKFAASRLGDVALLGGVGVTYLEFGTLHLASLFAAIEAGPASPEAATTLGVIGSLLALGAIAKSAQFPLHSWLPQTLETPTPVSALMHAGVVNSGGYLMIRMSPLIAQAPLALTLLTLFGAATVMVGGLSMVTQSSVKRTLAYSTVAQMGFMMLQCGLGAFSAALLHLVAHSLYKAYAFLNSGSVLEEAKGSSVAVAKQTPSHFGRAAFLLGPVGVVVGFVAVALSSGLDLTAKPGGVTLAAVLCLALSAGVLEAALSSSRVQFAAAMAGSLLLGGFYLAGYMSVDWLAAASLPALSAPAPWLSVLVIGLFIGLLLIQVAQRLGWGGRLLQPLYVHALNGFYVEAMVRRGVRSIRA